MFRALILSLAFFLPANASVFPFAFWKKGICTGGTITSQNGFTLHTFTASTTFSCPTARSVNWAIAAGGGGGGQDIGAGGGGGGVRYSANETTKSVTASTSYTVTIPIGGTQGSTGSNTSPGYGGNAVFDTITALGGAPGGYYNGSGWTVGSNGSSSAGFGASGGGGAIGSAAGGTGGGTGGNNGGTGGPNSGGTSASAGGGGCGAVGGNGANSAPGNGGNGCTISVAGGNKILGGGGGGGGHTFASPIGTGGTGGGGNGANTTNAVAGGSGSSNTGGGGGGAGFGFNGGPGGSGVLYVWY